MRVWASILAIAAAVVSSSACESAQSLIAAAEGFRACTYKDTTGHPTICYGYNLDNGNARHEIERVGGNWNSVIHGGCLSKAQCEKLLSTQVAVAAAGEHRIYGDQCKCITAVLTDMTYNLGEGGLSTFTTFNSLIKQHKWKEAADDVAHTLWCRQVGTRCTRDRDIIAHGCGRRALRGVEDQETAPAHE